MEVLERLPFSNKRTLEDLDGHDFKPTKRQRQSPPPTPDSLPTTPSATGRDVRPLIYHCKFPQCQRAFSRPCRLIEHERSHTGERPFVCSQCQKSFGRDYHLSRHVRLSHTDEREHACSWAGCGKLFATTQRRNVHERTHLKVKEFTCTGYEDCREVFRKKVTLAMHVKKVHLGIKPFQCDKIDSSTNELCTHGYETAGKLRDHIGRCHSNEARFFCNLCKVAPMGDGAEAMADASSQGGDVVFLGFKVYSDFMDHKRTMHPKISYQKLQDNAKPRKATRLSKPRRRANQHTAALEVQDEASAADLLTGAPTPDAELQCLQSSCPLLFANEELLGEHCCNAHGMAEVEISEALRERAANEGGVFWLGGLVDDDDESDMDGEEGYRMFVGTLMSQLNGLSDSTNGNGSEEIAVDPALL